jgi:hypothetical protein
MLVPVGVFVLITRRRVRVSFRSLAAIVRNSLLQNYAYASLSIVRARIDAVENEDILHCPTETERPDSDLAP